MTTSGFFNTLNPAPEDLRSAAEILAEALAAATAVAEDSQAAADAAEAAQSGAVEALGFATQAADALAATVAAHGGALEAAATAGTSAAQASDRADAAGQAAADAAVQLALAAGHAAAAHAARDEARGHRDSAGNHAGDAEGAAEAAAASALSSAGHAADATLSATQAGLAATAAATARDTSQGAADTASAHATAAAGSAVDAAGNVSAIAAHALAAGEHAQDAADAASQAAGQAIQAAAAAAAADGSSATAAAAATAATIAAGAAAESAADAAAAADAASGGGIRISATDTTPELLDASMAVAGGLTKTVANPGGNERLVIGLHTATTLTQGAMSAADKIKLDGLPAAAEIATKTYADSTTAAAIAAVIDAAPDELDTLREIAAHLAQSDDTTAALVTTIAAKADKTYVDAEIADLAGAEHSHDFAGLTNRPTTLAGYGITDAAGLAHVGAGSMAHALATTETAGFISAADQTKLNGIAAGAQPNAVTKIFGRTGAVAAASGDYAAAQITNIPTGSIVATTVQAAINELDGGKASLMDVTTSLAVKADISAMLSALESKSDQTHTHAPTDIPDLPIFSSGKYTPILTNISRLGAQTSPSGFYLRVGNIILATGQIMTSFDSAGSAEFTLSLPIVVSGNPGGARINGIFQFGGKSGLISGTSNNPQLATCTINSTGIFGVALYMTFSLSYSIIP